MILKIFINRQILMLITTAYCILKSKKKKCGIDNELDRKLARES